MENASKALIIAGAILVSILLIGIGVALINALSGTTETANDSMNATGIQVFNSKFTKYVGKQSGSNVLSLLSEIRTHNYTSQSGKLVNVAKGATQWKNAAGANINVNVADKNTASEIAAQVKILEDAVIKTHTYTVTVGYDAEGYINKVTFAY